MSLSDVKDYIDQALDRLPESEARDLLLECHKRVAYLNFVSRVESFDKDIDEYLAMCKRLINNIAQGHQHTNPDGYHIWWEQQDNLHSYGLQLEDEMNTFGYPDFSAKRCMFRATLNIIRFLTIIEDANLYEQCFDLLE